MMLLAEQRKITFKSAIKMELLLFESDMETYIWQIRSTNNESFLQQYLNNFVKLYNSLLMEDFNLVRHIKTVETEISLLDKTSSTFFTSYYKLISKLELYSNQFLNCCRLDTDFWMLNQYRKDLLTRVHSLMNQYANLSLL